MTAINITLRNVILENVAVDELIIMEQLMKLQKNGYKERKIPIPTWLEDNLDNIDLEIKMRIKADLKKRLATAQARRESLKTADEKRRDLDAEIEALKAQLNE